MAEMMEEKKAAAPAEPAAAAPAAVKQSKWKSLPKKAAAYPPHCGAGGGCRAGCRRRAALPQGQLY